MDQGSNLRESVIRLWSLEATKVEHKGTEAHNGFSFRVFYHEPIRTTVRKIFLEQPKEDFYIILDLTVNELKDTAVPDGLVPQSLLFGEFNRVIMTFEHGRCLKTEEHAGIAT